MTPRDDGTRRTSWVNALVERLDRLPAPSWLVFSVWYAVEALAVFALKWRDGTVPTGAADGLGLMIAFWTVYPLAAIVYLDGVADVAVRHFRELLPVDDRQFDGLKRDFISMPPRPTLIASLAGVLICVGGYVASPGLYAPSMTSPATAAVYVPLLALNFALLGALLYHSARQLAGVSRLYAMAETVDVFHVDHMHGLAGLTARTSVTWSLALVASLALYPQILDSPFVNVILGLQVFLVGAIFLAPLSGVHGRLIEAKFQAEAEASARLDRALAELHKRVDEGELGDMHAVNKMVLGLLAERDALARIHTWPWPPGAPIGVASAVLLPVLLYAVESILEPLFRRAAVSLP